MTTLCVGRLVVGMMLGSLATASAQNADAEAMFQLGTKLFAEGKLADACDAFDASNRIEARAGTLLRLGDCREHNHQLASAWSAYKDALARAKDPMKRELARAKAAELEARMSYLTITVAHHVDDLAITRDGLAIEPAGWNVALPIDGGEYVVAAHAPQFDDWTATVAVPAENAHVEIRVPELRAKPIAAPPPSVSTPAATSARVEADPSPFTRRRALAITAGAAGVLALAAGTVLGVSAKSKESDAYALCPDPGVACVDAGRAQVLVDVGHARAIAADVSFGVGAAALIAGAVLWFTGAPETAHAITLVPAAHGAAITGRF